jgi:hypothetical protein
MLRSARVSYPPLRGRATPIRERSLSHFLVERASLEGDTASIQVLVVVDLSVGTTVAFLPLDGARRLRISSITQGSEGGRGMVTRRWRRGRLVVLAVAIGAGCAQLERAIYEPGRSDVVDGEIWSIDPRNGRIDVRADRGGAVTMHYDRTTRVFYRQREYDPSALEPGDRVRALTTRDRNGTLWADRVDVLSSVRDEGSARIQRIEGVFGRSEPRRGYFTLVAGRETLFVYVPRNVGAAEVRRLDRLRSGDRVRLEVRVIGRGELELVRFR